MPGSGRSGTKTARRFAATGVAILLGLVLPLLGRPAGAQPPAQGPAPDERNGAAGIGREEPATPPREPVRLTLAEAVLQALRDNLDIRSASYDPKRAVQALKSARSVHDTSVFAAYTDARTDRPVQSFLDVGTTLESEFIEDRWLLRAGFKQPLPFLGGALSLFQEVEHVDSNSTLLTPNPQYTSRLTAQLRQPLLQGLGDKANEAAIEVAGLNVAITRVGLRERIMDVTVEVGRAYWQLVFDRDSERVARQTLEMASEVYRRELVRLQRGISKPLDVDRALAAVESRRAEVLRAQNRVSTSASQLKLLLNAPGLPLTEAVEVVPADAPRADTVTIDRDEAVAAALRNRPELERARKETAAGRVRTDLAGHRRLPKFDAVLSYSYNSLDTDFGDTAEEVYKTGKASWSAAVEFEWPIGGRGARAEYARARLEEEQRRVEEERVARQIAREIGLAADAIDLAAMEIETTSRARAAAEKVVAGENARFELGQSTNEELLRAQEFLAAAERDSMRALVSYNTNLLTLGRARGTLIEDLGLQAGR